MQIFGQNIFGLSTISKSSYAGEIDLVLRGLVNAQISVTNDNVLSSSIISISNTDNIEQKASITLST